MTISVTFNLIKNSSFQKAGNHKVAINTYHIIR